MLVGMIIIWGPSPKMIDLRTSENRVLNAMSRLGVDSFYDMIVSELNYASNPAALRTDSEHKYFRKRFNILMKWAERKHCPLRENENGRYYIPLSFYEQNRELLMRMKTLYPHEFS